MTLISTAWKRGCLLRIKRLLETYRPKVQTPSVCVQTLNSPLLEPGSSLTSWAGGDDHGYQGRRREGSSGGPPLDDTRWWPLGTAILIGLYGTWMGQSRGKSEVKCQSRTKQFNFVADAVAVSAPAVVFIEKAQPVKTFMGEAVAVSAGSGFIVDKRGFVLTNAHVVGNTRTVKVKLQSGKVVRGYVTDMDQEADLALVKLEVDPADVPLPVIKFGCSAVLRPGEWVVAMGSPLSLSNTITAGVVSSIHRPSKELGLQNTDMVYVQTDAAITVGNSGGPLVNLDGEVIGVNTMTAGPGISFAIPSDFAKSFVDHANREVDTPMTTKYVIGVSMLSVTSELLQALKMRGLVPERIQHGVYLAQVWPRSAAAEAGLRKGDVVVRVNGRTVKSSRTIYDEVQQGRRLEMEVVRGSEALTVVVVPEPA